MVISMLLLGRTMMPERVVLVGRDHPWVGYSGEPIEDKGDGLLVVRLDDGQEVFAWPRQWRRAK